MPNKILTDEMLNAVGFATTPVTYEIERGAIRKFAQAIEDPNALFNDEQAARKTRFGGMIAPPTFGRMLGGIFLIWADVLSRILVAPEELPVGIITAMFGAPFFIWLMQRNGGGVNGGK